MGKGAPAALPHHNELGAAARVSADQHPAPQPGQRGRVASMWSLAVFDPALPGSRSSPGAALPEE